MSALVTASSQTAMISNDQQLALQIRRQLSSNSRAIARLQIEVADGVVTLRGVATSFYQKQLWLHGAKRVVGDDAPINDEIGVTFAGEN